MRKITIALYLFIIISGCIKESSTSYTARLRNPTNHKIEITPYKNGSSSNGSIVLMANAEFTIANGSDRGIVNHGGFDSEYLSGQDSLLVVYNDSFKMIHYNTTPTIVSQKSYTDTSSRSLFNYLNYEYLFEDKSKYSRLAYYTFTFTEQDYLDAKE